MISKPRTLLAANLNGVTVVHMVSRYNLRASHGISSFLTIIEQTQVSYCYLVGFGV